MKYKVIKDSREKDGWDFPLTVNCDGTKVMKLDTGDYTIEGCEDILCIERKGGIGEFAQNLIQDRFYKELERTKEFKFAYLLLEFEMYDILDYPRSSTIPQYKWGLIKITPQLILSKFLSLQHNFPDLKIILVGNNGHRVAETIFNKVQKYAEQNVDR